MALLKKIVDFFRSSDREIVLPLHILRSAR